MALRPIMQLKLLCIKHLGLYRCQKQPTNFSDEAIFSARPTEGVELLVNTLYGNFDPFELVTTLLDNAHATLKIIEAL